MQAGTTDRTESEGQVADWFRTFGKDELDDIWVTEQFHPIPIMGTMLVLLTIDENDIAVDEEEEDD